MQLTVTSKMSIYGTYGTDQSGISYDLYNGKVLLDAAGIDILTFVTYSKILYLSSSKTLSVKNDKDT